MVSLYRKLCSLLLLLLLLLLVLMSLSIDGAGDIVTVHVHRAVVHVAVPGLVRSKKQSECFRGSHTDGGADQMIRLRQ